MRVIRAATAGFCMGVSLALKKLENSLERRQADNSQLSSASRICTLGPIIHNPQVLEHFKSLGVVCINDASEAQKHDHALIRAHGITREDEAILRARCENVEDATCPKVKKAQLSIEQATGGKAFLLLFGEADHPEVRGLVSYAQNGAHVFGSPQELDQLELKRDQSYVLASQTTQNREIFERIAERLTSQLPMLKVLSTICDATRLRQEEAARIASQVDIMIVVGGKESGNTRRLASMARQAAIETFHVECADELRPADFIGKKCAGLTAGASTPKNLIDDAENWLKSF